MTNLLKRLELHGFKSFAQKTTLEFPARLVAIVGPNGSGKSNIIDAFRWILGEREAKHLRGDTLGNLIFAGTPKRAPLGFAKVALAFDNSSKLFPFDTEEVMLQRRVDRSGVSQFLLHDSEVRLKELVPMLARARLGARGLTMIGQGESDVFVRSNPEDRRAMIEEVLGLREFRLKKIQAERRLTSSEINMEKVRAMIEELMPHLKLLRRQKHRWDKRSEIEATLHALENEHFSHAYHEIQRGLGRLVEPIETLAVSHKEREGEARAIEAELKSFEVKDDAVTSKQLLMELNALLDRRAGLERSLARLEAQVELRAQSEAMAKSDVAELSRLLNELRELVSEMLSWDDIVKIKETLKETLGKLDKATNKDAKVLHESLQKEIQGMHAELEVIDREMKITREKEARLAEDQKKANQEFRAVFGRLEEKKNEMRRLEEERQRLMFEKEKLQLRFEEVLREWRTIGRHEDELRRLPVMEATMPREEVERKMLRLRGELAAIGEIDATLVQEADESEKRYEFLSKELDDLEHASKDMKQLIKTLEAQIHESFKTAFKSINEEFNTYFRLMFGGGKARMKLEKFEVPVAPEEGGESGMVSEEGGVVPQEVPEEEKGDPELHAGVEIELQLPKKRITSLDMLSGGEKSLVSLAALFALISVSPPPFLVLDEIDAALDEENARRFSELIKEFSKKSQFVIVTHNRSTMEAADILYGITMGDDGVSQVLSLKLENVSV